MSDQIPNPFLINELDLVGECLKQSQLARDAGTREADARHQHAQAKARLDVVRAKLRMRIRNAPDVFGLGPKPVVDAVDDATDSHDEVAAAVRQLNEAKYELDLAEADKEAFVDRRKMIEGLIKLLSINYHTEREPRPVSTETRDAVESRRRRAVRGDANA